MRKVTDIDRYWNFEKGIRQTEILLMIDPNNPKYQRASDTYCLLKDMVMLSILESMPSDFTESQIGKYHLPTEEL